METTTRRGQSVLLVVGQERCIGSKDMKRNAQSCLCSRKVWKDMEKYGRKKRRYYTTYVTRCIEGDTTASRREHHNASTHTPTIPICRYAARYLALLPSLSLYPFSRSSTCVYIVLYAIYEPVCPL